MYQTPTTTRDRKHGPEASILEALQQASAKELIALLFRFELAEPFLRQLKEREVVFKDHELSDPDTILSSAVESYLHQHRLSNDEDITRWRLNHAMSTDDLASEAIHSFRCHELRTKLISGNGETLYLRYKDKLDRVIYSLLRVADPNFCQELFYSIEAGEISFQEAASRYSVGPESKTQGIIGPVDMTTPHPSIAARLRTGSPGQLLGPFDADSWHMIARIEYRFDSEYDHVTREFLEQMYFKSMITSQLNKDIEELALWLREDSA
jgi:parvulin-like peptidyl-prolyl isomerase